MSVPNLDAFPTPLALLQWARTIKPREQPPLADVLFPEKPQEHVKAANMVVTYAKWKAIAMRARIDGDINLALRHEHNCDILYAKLPDYARW